MICQTCADKSYTCAHCEDVFLDDGTSKTILKKKYCFKCFALYKRCSHCNHTGFDVEEYQNELGGQACLKCRTKRGLYQIKKYNFIPRRLEMSGEGPLFYGLENELSAGKKGSMENLCAHIAKLGNPLMFIKHDGSVENGIEVVTHPADFTTIKTLGFEKMFGPGVVAHKSCGFHVHMSRAAFDSVHLFKFVKFFNTCQAQIEALAGRTYELTYQNGRSVKKTEEHEISDLIAGKIRDKYREVRLNCEHTIEVRVFRGATTPEELWKFVEFCDVVYYFTMGDMSHSTWDNFNLMVKTNQQKYPNLHAYLSKFN